MFNKAHVLVLSCIHKVLSLSSHTVRISLHSTLLLNNYCDDCELTVCRLRDDSVNVES